MMNRLAPVLLVVVAGCGSPEPDSAELERMAARADSLFAEPSAIGGVARVGRVDSLRYGFVRDSIELTRELSDPALDAPAPAPSVPSTAAARVESRAGRLDAEGTALETDGTAGSSVLEETSTDPSEGLSRRAQARGDSMAKAQARRMYAPVDDASRSRGDTVRGVIALAGSAPTQQAVLRDARGSMIALSGMATSGLASLEGAEVVVRGVKVTGRDVVVADYFVRAVNGVPAVDGRLDAGDGGWTVTLSDGSGRQRLAAAPAGLRALAGSRVWISLRDGVPQAFGPVGRR